MNVYWFEQTEADVPASNEWLCEGEFGRVVGMRFSKRRAEFRLGRWTAKCAVAARLNLPGNGARLAAIEIGAEASGAPRVILGGEAAAFPISLSHRAGVAACAIGEAGAALGCDLELIEERGEAFAADYFAAEELAALEAVPAADRACLTTAIWSAKESALKALGEGLRLDTRSVVVSMDYGGGADWRAVTVRGPEGRTLHGWWRAARGLVRTVAACPAPGRPIPLPGFGPGGQTG